MCKNFYDRISEGKSQILHKFSKLETSVCTVLFFIGDPNRVLLEWQTFSNTNITVVNVSTSGGRYVSNIHKTMITIWKECWDHDRHRKRAFLHSYYNDVVEDAFHIHRISCKIDHLNLHADVQSSTLFMKYIMSHTVFSLSLPNMCRIFMRLL